ncbi:MAG: MFS transporter [Desulfofustis sp.]
MSVATLMRVFLPFAAGYFLSYLFRVVNAVLAPDLATDIGVGPSDLGLLTSVYFITFASFQLPLGILLDRYGPRKTEAILLLFAGLGAFIFSRADTLAGLVAGRALIGFGVSACLMASFKAYTVWFDRTRWTVINGFQMASGGLGALAATSPVEWLVSVSDWRTVFVLLALLSVIIAVLVLTVVPEKQSNAAKDSFGSQLRGIGEVFTSLKFWHIAPLVTMSQTGFLAVQGLWAGPWLRDVIGLERGPAASMLFWVAVAMIVGFIVLGFAAARLSRLGIHPARTSAFCMALFMAVQLLVLVAPSSYYAPVWLAFGFIGTAGIIAYAGLSQLFETRLSGRVTTGVNLLVFISAFSWQWLIGVIIEHWPLNADGSYHEAGFYYGFGLLIVCQLGALVWYLIGSRLLARPK